MTTSDFIKNQLSFLRVKEAFEKMDFPLQQLFLKNELSFPAQQLYIRIFKLEQIIEIWSSDNLLFKLIKTYTFTATSGTSGPKQREGDSQIPEGFYQITNFNPESKFHLSLRINYPNAADAIRNKNEQNLGGDIYIHGGKSTTGCIPIGDENIEELYWLCVKFYAVNSVIPVHIFPCKMEEENLEKLNKEYPQHITFWSSIKPMYQYFQSHKTLPK